MSKVAFIRCKNVVYEIEDEEAQLEIENIYTKEEVNNLITAISRANFVIVSELPTKDISPTTIYLLPVDSKKLSEGYYEYVYIRESWEIIGITKTDFSQYYTKNEMDALLEGKQDSIVIDTELSETSENFLTNKTITLALNSKVSTTEFLEALANKADKSEIKTKLSELEDDIGVIYDLNYVHTDNNYTTAEKTKLAGMNENAQANVQSDWNQADTTKDDFIKNKPSLHKVASSGKYSDLIGVPLVLSSFTNDLFFINKTADNLTNYYLKDDTYTKTEVNKLIGDISSIKIIIVEELPTTEIKENAIYLVPSQKTGSDDIYDEYLYISNKWERIGSSKVDLSNYYTKDEIDTKLSGKQDVFTTLDIDKGGTSGKTAKEATFYLFNDINESLSDIEDSDYLITSVPTPNNKTGPFNKKSVGYLWNWIVSKLSSVLGLTKDNYGGKASTADSATKASQDANGNDIATTYATKSEIPTSLPASDVPSWAKAENKPTYTASEVGAASASHNHPSSDINALTGYSKPEETSAIVATDSLNTALGKLEKALETRATGSVTSVRVQATSPVQSSVSSTQTSTLDTTISLADNYGDTKNPYAVKNAHQVLAAPSTEDGLPTFRSLVASDIPTLNQDTTGNAATATYATYLGTSSNKYSKSDLDTALGSKITRLDIANNRIHQTDSCGNGNSYIKISGLFSSSWGYYSSYRFTIVGRNNEIVELCLTRNSSDSSYAFSAIKTNIGLDYIKGIGYSGVGADCVIYVYVIGGYLYNIYSSYSCMPTGTITSEIQSDSTEYTASIKINIETLATKTDLNSAITAQKTFITLTSESDIDNMRVEMQGISNCIQWYNYNSLTANNPYYNDMSGHMVVYYGSDSVYEETVQWIYPHSSTRTGDPLYRTFQRWQGKWTKWNKVATESSVTSALANYLPLSGGTLTGSLYVNRSAVSVPSFRWNKEGTYWSGIGYGGTSNETVFGAVNADGIWCDSIVDTWAFRGVGVKVGTRMTKEIPTDTGYTDVNRIQIEPPYHTGGPWFINTLDNSSSAFLRVMYNTSENFYMKHDGEVTFHLHDNSWLKDSYIQIGRKDTSVFGNKAVIGVTDGNLHLDAYENKGLYLNFYSKSGNVYFNGDGYYINGGYYNGASEYVRTRAKDGSSHGDSWRMFWQWDGSFFRPHFTSGETNVRVSHSDASASADTLSTFGGKVKLQWTESTQSLDFVFL